MAIKFYRVLSYTVLVWISLFYFIHLGQKDNLQATLLLFVFAKLKLPSVERSCLTTFGFLASLLHMVRMLAENSNKLFCNINVSIIVVG